MAKPEGRGQTRGRGWGSTRAVGSRGEAAAGNICDLPCVADGSLRGLAENGVEAVTPQRGRWDRGWAQGEVRTCQFPECSTAIKYDDFEEYLATWKNSCSI